MHGGKAAPVGRGAGREGWGSRYSSRRTSLGDPPRLHVTSANLPDLLSRARIVLVKTTHPGNIGATARAMLTMGLSELYLVQPKRFPDPDATAMAAGADRVLEQARVVESLDEALAGTAFSVGMSARRRELAQEVLPVREAAVRTVQALHSAPAAIVFGTEMSGLSNDELSRCSVVGTIPANPAFSSLNVAAAVQLASYELRVAAEGSAVWATPRFPAATHEEVAALLAHANRTLAAIGFLDPSRPRRLLPRLRRLFARRGLEHEEVNILRGILTAIDEQGDATRRR